MNIGVICAQILGRIDFFQLQHVVRVPLHNHTLGICLVTNIQLSIAISFLQQIAYIDDVIKFLHFWRSLAILKHALLSIRIWIENGQSTTIRSV